MLPSMTLSPSTPFTFKSRSTTSHFAAFGLIAAVPVGWNTVPAFALIYASSAAFVVVAASAGMGLMMYPSRAYAVRRRFMALTASLRVKMSNAVERKAGSMAGAVKGLEDVSLMELPVPCGDG
jgi:hypothetical protein